MANKSKWRWLVPLLLGIGFLALCGIGFSSYLFSSWTEVRPLEYAEAMAEFDLARSRTGGGPSYLTISPEGSLELRTDLEGPEPVPIEILHLLAWSPDSEKLLQIEFPFWFVRVKMSDTVNLGTVTAALAQDWENLQLKVSVEELERRGPGLILDHRREDGARILLWTEAKAPPDDSSS